jgi:exodeoxyribonuclease VII small subunit
MTKQKLTYDEAVAELEQILKELETNENINMDNIAAKVKRAAVLLEFCKKQLHELDSDIQKMMEELDNT